MVHTYKACWNTNRYYYGVFVIYDHVMWCMRRLYAHQHMWNEPYDVNIQPPIVRRLQVEVLSNLAGFIYFFIDLFLHSFFHLQIFV